MVMRLRNPHNERLFSYTRNNTDRPNQIPFTFLANVCGKKTNFMPLASLSVNEPSLVVQQDLFDDSIQVQRGYQHDIMQSRSLQKDSTPSRSIKIEPSLVAPLSREEAFSNLMQKLEKNKNKCLGKTQTILKNKSDQADGTKAK
ncbi:hypothetical protein FGO68_gene8566 [Halteria grandinella]|uniref:Uncharacterized protein n=1 Tax=Halteria grandinella TaxID=5974 RepID=A0A8J8SUS2_HALGN|nr:hypothetical protein FGO68_gene8566 [Halteria grandinella]